MKKIIIILALILGINGINKAQNISFANAAVMLPNDNTRGVQIGDDVGQAIAILGSPQSITDKYFEMDEVTAKVYSYGSNKLYFVNGKLDSYNLVDNSLQAGTVNGITMKVGDAITVTTRTITRPKGQHGSVTETITTKTFFNFNLKEGYGKVNGLQYNYRVTCQILRNGVPTDYAYGLLFGSDYKLVSINVGD